MSRKKKKNEPQVNAAASNEAQGKSEAAVESVEAAQAAEQPSLEQQIERLHDENLRLMAELRNVRNRTQREKQEALKFAEASFARELLIVLDDLERTQESAKTAENAQAVTEGVRIVYEHFIKVLASRGIEPVAALGQPFDPNLHEALMQQPSNEYPEKTVMQELARGYKMHGRVIRPAKVIVSSGPPTPAEQHPADSQQGESDADL